MLRGNIIFVVAWFVLGGVFTTSYAIDGWGFWGCLVEWLAGYFLTGVVLTALSGGRLRLIMGWMPAMFSARACEWTRRGGEILGKVDCEDRSER